MEFRFADCALDPVRHRLTRGGEDVHVEPQVFALLRLLVERAGELVTRDELVEQVWDGRIVSDATISARINAARAAVGDSGQSQSVIRTVTRRGLQLVVPVARAQTAEPDLHPPPPVAPKAPVVVRMTASADGTGIAWCKSGTGPPLLRAGHWLTHLERDVPSPIWGPWLARMQRGRTLVRYDTRGTGMSGNETGPMTLDTFVEDMLAVADAARLDRFSIFSASQSTAVACAFAVRYPDRVERIFSYGGWPEGSRVRDPAAGDTMTDAIHMMLKHGWGQPEGGHMRAFSSMMLPGASRDQVRAFVELQINSATADRATEVREVISRFDVKDILPEVPVPVCVVHAAQDSIHPIAQAHLLARLLPDAQLHTVDSVNHILLDTEPAFGAMMDLLDAFLAGELD